MIAGFEGRPEQFRSRTYTADAADASVADANADVICSVGKLRQATTEKLGREAGNSVSLISGTLAQMDAELALAKVSISGTTATIELDHHQLPLVCVDGRWRVKMRDASPAEKEQTIQRHRASARFIDSVTAKVKSGDLKMAESIQEQMKQVFWIESGFMKYPP